MITLLAQVIVVLCAVGIGIMVGRKFMGREGRAFGVPSRQEQPPAQTASVSMSRPSARFDLQAVGRLVTTLITRIRPAVRRFTEAARRVAGQAGPVVVKVIRRSQAEFDRWRPAIERLIQAIRARLAAFIRALQPKIGQALSRGKVMGRAALRTAVQAGRAGHQASKKGLVLLQGRIEALSNTLKHIRMRQTEHARRMRTKEKFLGELMAKVQKPEDKPAATPPPIIQEAAPSAPPIAPPPAQTPQPAAGQVHRPPFWSRFKLPHPADRPKISPEITASPARPEEPENQERMVKILHEQEQIILRQIVKHPKDITLYKRLGFVYLELDESADAVECFRQAVKLGSQDPLVRKELQRLLAH